MNLDRVFDIQDLVALAPSYGHTYAYAAPPAYAGYGDLYSEGGGHVDVFDLEATANRALIRYLRQL